MSVGETTLELFFLRYSPPDDKEVSLPQERSTSGRLLPKGRKNTSAFFPPFSHDWANQPMLQYVRKSSPAHEVSA
jgi:hypothetical protein